MLISALAFVVVIEPRKNNNNIQDSSENSSEINNETLQLKESDAGITSDVNNLYTIIESLKEILESDEARSLYLATFFRFCNLATPILVRKSAFLLQHCNENTCSLSRIS